VRFGSIPRSLKGQAARLGGTPDKRSKQNPMLKWTDLRRSSDTVLAVWPQYRPLHERWFMQELVDKGEFSPTWRDRMVPGENDAVFVDHYADRESASAAANALNPILRQALIACEMDTVAKQSLELKIDKALQSKQRLQDEEALMLAEALRRHAADQRPDTASLKLVPESESYRHDLAEQLTAMPYLRLAKVGRSNGRWTHLLLYKGPDGVWSKPYAAGERAAMTAERAKIANGFDLSASAHWGKTKAEIRRILLPRANQLLQLASVQRLLAEALSRGERVLVSNGIVFWYEQDGGVGWQVKETSSTRESEGATIWKEGTIRSTNHGRLVILPYIKENGEQVRGHTKNGPNDGRALPRHPDHYVDIPFSLYDGDLMIGLFGELPYE